MKIAKHKCKLCKYLNIGLESSTCIKDLDNDNQRQFITETIDNKYCMVVIDTDLNTPYEIIEDNSWEDQKRFEDTGARILALLSQDGKCQISDYGDTIDKDGNITYWTR